MCSVIDDFLTSFGSAFCVKTVTKQTIQKTFEKKKIAGTVPFVLRLAKYQCKWIIENGNSVSEGVHKVEKIVYGHTLTLEILWNYVYNSTFMFLNIF